MEVAIKFGTEEHYSWVEKEYKNFLHLGADGEFDFAFYIEVMAYA